MADCVFFFIIIIIITNFFFFFSNIVDENEQQNFYNALPKKPKFFRTRSFSYFRFRVFFFFPSECSLKTPLENVETVPSERLV